MNDLTSFDDDDVINYATRLLRDRIGTYKREPMDASASVCRYLRLHFHGKEREEFYVLYLNNQHELIICETASLGTIDCAPVYPREIAKSALRHNAAAVILSHNHPSGTAEPSTSDRLITTAITDALRLIDVRVLDHIVVGDLDTVSFADRGLI